MSIQYATVEDAIARKGLRMVVVGKVPSPWGEAAKGILHIKRIPFTAVRLVYDSDSLKNWAGQLTGPVAVYDNERIHERSKAIVWGIDARAQRFPAEDRYVYQPFAGQAGDYRYDSDTLEQLRDYNRNDLGI